MIKSAERCKYEKEWRLKNKTKVKEYEKLKWERKKKCPSKYYRIPKTKYKARMILNNAINVGKIKKPKLCESCGNGKTVIHGHHVSYSKPLEVKWLCPSCHYAEHGR